MNQREWRTANGRVALTAISNVTNVSSYRWLSKFNFEANYPEAKPDPKPTEFDGYFTVKSALSGDASLDVASGSLDPGANVQLWTANGTSAQVLHFRYDAHAGAYEITNAKSGLALDVQGGSARPGGNVQQFTRNGTGAQRWAIADNADGTVTIASAKNPSCVLDAAGGKSAPGTNVQLYRSNGTTAQKWVLESH